MKQIIVYVASDGSRFDDPVKCDEYEVQCRLISNAVAPLGVERRIDSGEFFQHTREACMAAKVALVGVFQAIYPTWDLKDCRPEDVHPLGVVGRVISDGNHNALNRAWNRLGCINWELFREYGQPYFANHPSEATREVK